MTATNRNGNVATTIRLPQKRLTALLDELDAVSDDQGGRSGPKRYCYRHDSIIICVLESGSGMGRMFRVHTRCMSEQDLCCLHGGYLHMGTPCSLQLETLHDTTNTVRGKIADCRYVGAGVHELAIAFDDPLDVSSYCSAASPCRVLVVDDDENVVRLVMHHLSKLNTELEHAGDGAEGVRKALSCAFDLILMDIHMPTLGGIEALQQLREKEYAGPIAAFTGDQSADEITQLLAAGFDHYVAKPFTFDDLAHVVGLVREEPLLSKFHSDESMLDMIRTFVMQLPDLVQQLEAAGAQHNREAVLRAATRLKETGASFGFAEISEAASAVEENARSGDSAMAILRLARLARRVRGN